MKTNELLLLIEEKREELDKLVARNLPDLRTDDIIKISNELDELIAMYLNIYE